LENPVRIIDLFGLSGINKNMHRAKHHSMVSFSAQPNWANREPIYAGDVG
jgi:hypothetical protein